MRRQLLLVLIAAAGLVACTGESDDARAAVDRSATVVASSTAIPTPPPGAATPVIPVAPTITQTEVGDVRPLSIAPSAAELRRYDAALDIDDGGAVWQKLYAVDRDELWTTADPAGGPYPLSLSPYGDVGVGAADDRYANRAIPTVLVDFTTGEVRDLFPFPVEVRHWTGPQRVLIRVSRGAAAPPRSVGWTAGIYELDLEAETATLISISPDYRAEVPVPPGSALGTGVIEWRVDREAGRTDLILRNGNVDSERVLAADLGYVGWAPSHRYAVLVGRHGDLSIFDPLRGESLDLSGLGLGRASIGSWSADARYFVARRTYPTVVVDTAGLEGNFEVDALRLIGPFEEAIFADWGPGASPTEVLLLAEYCAPDGFWLDRADLETGDVTRIATDVAEFWVHDWSPRGDLIAVSSWKVDTGFTLVDAVTGERQRRPNLEAVVTTMQDVQWSGSGDWIALQQIGGRDRCAV